MQTKLQRRRLIALLISAILFLPLFSACADSYYVLPPECFPEFYCAVPVTVPAVKKAPSVRSTGAPTSSVVPFLAASAKSEIRIRASASAYSQLLKTLKVGETVVVLGQTTGADSLVWYRVMYGTLAGYVRYDQVEVMCGTAQLGGPTEPVGRCVGQTNIRAVNVRLEMSTRSSRVRLLRRGQTVTILGLSYDQACTPWYYVVLPSGAIGYIRGDLLSVVSGTVVEAPMPQVKYAGVPAVNVSASAYAWSNPYYTYGQAVDDTESDAYTQEVDDTENGSETADALSSTAEELIYLRYLNANISGLAAIGNGYQSYSFIDLDGDGVHECIVDCQTESAYVWQIYTIQNGNVADLGTLTAHGYYLGGEGKGLLLVQVLSDTQTEYTMVHKVENSLVVMYTITRTADSSWHYTWTYNHNPIDTQPLLRLLDGFTDDVLQNLGLYRYREQIATPPAEVPSAGQPPVHNTSGSDTEEVLPPSDSGYQNNEEDANG